MESLQKKSGDSEPVDKGSGCGWASKHINCPLHTLGKTCGGLLYLEAKSAYYMLKHDVQPFTLKLIGLNSEKFRQLFGILHVETLKHKRLNNSLSPI